MTGLDRPFPELKLRVRFFGRPAPLPTAHVYMALKAKVPVVVVAPVLQSDGRYHILASEFITMQPHPDRDTELVQNAERVLLEVEDIIREHPHQWSMVYPIWPEAIAEMPP